MVILASKWQEMKEKYQKTVMKKKRLKEKT